MTDTEYRQAVGGIYTAIELVMNDINETSPGVRRSFGSGSGRYQELRRAWRYLERAQRELPRVDLASTEKEPKT